jgi:hypothetical protein
LALHVTNRYVNLVPVAASGARSFHMQAMVVSDDGHEAGYLSSSTWVLLSSDGRWFKSPSFATSDITPPVVPSRFRTWTDDYSSISQIIKWTSQPAAHAQPRNWDIVPGQGMGPVGLWADIRVVNAVLGPEMTTRKLSDGGILHLWFAAPAFSGFGATTTQTGKVSEIWIQNDGRYLIKGHLHAGSTEAEVRAALGQPSRLSVNPEFTTKTLWYDSQGVWLKISLDPRRRFYNAVYSIGVVEPK